MSGLPGEILFEILRFFTRNDLEKIQVVNSRWNELIKKSNCLALRSFPSLTILSGPDGNNNFSAYVQLRYQSKNLKQNFS